MRMTTFACARARCLFVKPVKLEDQDKEEESGQAEGARKGKVVVGDITKGAPDDGKAEEPRL